MTAEDRYTKHSSALNQYSKAIILNVFNLNRTTVVCFNLVNHWPGTTIKDTEEVSSLTTRS